MQNFERRVSRKGFSKADGGQEKKVGQGKSDKKDIRGVQNERDRG